MIIVTLSSTMNVTGVLTVSMAIVAVVTVIRLVKVIIMCMYLRFRL